MPKMKTHSGAKKRFKMTATGRVKAGVAGKRHRLSSHDADYIRSHRGTKILKKGDEGLVKWYMPYQFLQKIQLEVLLIHNNSMCRVQ